MKYKLICFFLILTIGLYAQKRHTISGTVSDATTGETLIGASITVSELPGTGVTTNSYGYFSLTVPDGKYSFEFSYLSYDTKIIKLNHSEK